MTGRSYMEFDERDGALADMGVELDEVSEILGGSMDEIETWRDQGAVPQTAIDFLADGNLDTEDAIAYAEDELKRE